MQRLPSDDLQMICRPVTADSFRLLHHQKLPAQRGAVTTDCATTMYIETAQHAKQVSSVTRPLHTTTM
jgi:hypothetical protein